MGGWRIAVASKHELCLSMSGDQTQENIFTKNEEEPRKRGCAGQKRVGQDRTVNADTALITTELGTQLLNPADGGVGLRKGAQAQLCVGSTVRRWKVLA